MKARRIELGTVWRCECGRRHKADTAYLAAHWTMALDHTCQCGRVHTLENGVLTLKTDIEKKGGTK